MNPFSIRLHRAVGRLVKASIRLTEIGYESQRPEHRLVYRQHAAALANWHAVQRDVDAILEAAVKETSSGTTMEH